MKRIISRSIKIIVITPIACCALLIIAGSHGHGHTRPKLFVKVSDETGRPLQGVEIVFLDSSLGKMWGLCGSDNHHREETLQLIHEDRQMLQLIHKHEPVTKSDEHGCAVLEGRFFITAYIWHLYIAQEGALLLTKIGYMPTVVQFAERQWRRPIRRGKVYVEAILPETDHKDEE
jgi:hypothetical protein